ncbi:TRAP transporter small permease [Pollutimonas thiosulfatoxidans]|uniref:TRAP transporter small permease n=1 Tax=Pollutimonas thiosulfatoxidans TaxID=2028345 RepID=UPI001D19751E|nr:TRAP transporter small permease [Pollutimonas thiosulfatoxidans]
MPVADHTSSRLLKKIADGLFRLLTVAIAFSMLLMLLLVFGNVVMRYVFNSGINISEEVARMCFVWLIFIGAVLAFRAKQHLAISMLITRFSPRWQKIVHVLRQLIILTVLGLLIEGGWAQTVIGLSTVTPVSGVPIAVFSGAVWFCATAMAVMTLIDLWIALRTPATAENTATFMTSLDYIEDI